jgi:hypothetical protein
MADIDLEALARAIAPLLDGGTWQYKPNTDGTRQATILGPEGAVIHLSSDWSGKGRVKVDGSYPRDHHNRWVMDSVKRYDEALPSITVSASRQPKDLAADILRRFVPLYLGFLRAAQAEVAKRKAYEDKRNSLLDYACGFLGTRQYGQATDYKRSTGAQLAPALSVTVEATDQAKVTLEIDGITTLEELRAVLDKARKLAEELRPE